MRAAMSLCRRPAFSRASRMAFPNCNRSARPTASASRRARVERVERFAATFANGSIRNVLANHKPSTGLGSVHYLQRFAGVPASSASWRHYVTGAFRLAAPSPFQVRLSAAVFRASTVISSPWQPEPLRWIRKVLGISTRQRAVSHRRRTMNRQGFAGL